MLIYLIFILWGTIGALSGKLVYLPVVTPLAEKITI
jgi:hypothetical protein